MGGAHFNNTYTPLLEMEKKIQIAKQRVLKIGDAKINLAYSGGKDCIVAGHLISKFRKIEKAICEASWVFEKAIEDFKFYEDIIKCKAEYLYSVPIKFIHDRPYVIFSNDAKVRAMTCFKRQQRTIKKLLLKDGLLVLEEEEKKIG